MTEVVWIAIIVVTYLAGLRGIALAIAKQNRGVYRPASDPGTPPPWGPGGPAGAVSDE